MEGFGSARGDRFGGNRVDFAASGEVRALLSLGFGLRCGVLVVLSAAPGGKRWRFWFRFEMTFTSRCPSWSSSSKPGRKSGALALAKHNLGTDPTSLPWALRCWESDAKAPKTPNSQFTGLGTLPGAVSLRHPRASRAGNAPGPVRGRGEPWGGPCTPKATPKHPSSLRAEQVCPAVPYKPAEKRRGGGGKNPGRFGRVCSYFSARLGGRGWLGLFW